jgi:amino acid transporter
LATAQPHGLSPAGTILESTPTSLRKELGFLDLVLASILLVVIPDFFGTAVKAGPAHVLLWLIAIATFFIPQALVVAHLNGCMPIEGGLYEWARHAFGDAVGFLVAWNLWLYVVLYVASIGLVATTYAAYALGLDADATASNKWLVLAVSVAIIGVLMLVAHLGLRVGKWVTNAGSALTILIILFLAALPFLHLGHGTLHEYHPLGIVAPPLTLFSFSVFSKMTFGALCGFEYAAIFAGESRNPAKHLSRAILIAAPIIVLLYIFGSSAILAYVSPDKVDVIGPIPQALRLALCLAARASDCSRRNSLAADELPLQLQPEFCGQHTLADVRRLGSSTAKVVHDVARQVPHSGKLDSLPRGHHACRQYRRLGWSGSAGGV